MNKRNQLTEEHLNAAREVYASDSLHDIHNRLFVEMAVLLQGRGAATDLSWKNVRFEESAIVFEKYERETRDFEEIYEAERRGIRLEYVKSERWVEIKRLALSPEHIQLLTQWSDKLQDFRAAKDVEEYEKVFCSFYSATKPDVYHNRYSNKNSLRGMSNSEPKVIIDRCRQWIVENRLKDKPRASEIRQRLTEIDNERASLQSELDQLSRGVQPKLKGTSTKPSWDQFKEVYGFAYLPNDRGGLEKLYAAGIRSREAIEQWLEHPSKIKGIAGKGIQDIRDGLKRVDQENKGDAYAKGIIEGINPIPVGAYSYIPQEILEAQYPYEFDWSGYGHVTQNYLPCPDIVSMRIDRRNGQSTTIDVPFKSLSYWGFGSDVLDRLFPIDVSEEVAAE